MSRVCFAFSSATHFCVLHLQQSHHMQIRRLFAAPITLEQDVQYDVDMAIICGPARSGKTSMLFAYAYSYAQENRSVTFICSKKKIQNTLPIFPTGVVPSPEILEKIHMKYIEDDKSLRNYFANIHMFPQVPELIVIDDMANFFGGISQSAVPLAKSLAFAKEAVSYCTTALKKILPQQNCLVLMSDFLGSDLIPRQQNILQKWIPLIFVVAGVSISINAYK
eukprot:Phypoly_transcript_10171.p1 GENE.Phypoly_transcript_10171~~Phypoly_transcript_10171.p1  ORF type:complete len:222 (+),score=25.68 Phypoly_transcript_10171:121-786(+)